MVDQPIDDSYEGASHGSRSDCLAPLKISKKDTYGPKFNDLRKNTGDEEGGLPR